MSKSLTVLQWILSILFLLCAAGVIGLLGLIFRYYPEYVPAPIRPVPVSAAVHVSATPFAAVPTITLTPFIPATNTPSTPTLTYTPPPTSTPTLTFTPTHTETPLPTHTPLPTETPLPSSTPQPPVTIWPPSEAIVNGVVGYPQQYTLDCESRSAVDLAAYFGFYIDQMEFQDGLPASDDPEEGFVGYYWGTRGQLPPASYGVHAGPIAARLRAYGLNAVDSKYVAWETIQAEIASGRPVMVWVTGNTEPGWPVPYTASNGRTTTVARYEHTVIVIGYTPTYVTLVDGDMVYMRSLWEFLDSWGVLGNMAVMVEG